MKLTLTSKILNKSLLFVGALVTFSSQAHAGYNFTDLGVLGGDTSSYATSINNAGEVVGYSGYGTGFSWSSAGGMIDQNAKYSLGFMRLFSINDSGTMVGRYTDPVPTSDNGSLVTTGVVITKSGTISGIGTLPTVSRYSEAVAINNNGIVAGYATQDTGTRAVTWNQITGISPIEGFAGTGNSGSASDAVGINDKGQIVGWSTNDYPNTFHATMWENGVANDLGSLWSGSSFAQAINNSGQVAGYSYTDGGYSHATLWDGSAIIDLGSFYSTLTSAALSINNLGDVVGFSYTPGTSTHAILWKDGKTIDLNSLLDEDAKKAGWVLVKANDVNDSGWIVGDAYNTQTGYTHGFLLSALSISPVPEPSSYALFALGFVVMGYRAKRFRH